MSTVKQLVNERNRIFIRHLTAVSKVREYVVSFYTRKIFICQFVVQKIGAGGASLPFVRNG